MLFAGLLIGILAGWIRGGSVSRLVRMPIRHIYLSIVPLALEAGQSLLLLRAAWMTQAISFGMTILQYLPLFIFFFLNRHIWEALLCGAGSILNFTAIAANLGAMPLTRRVLDIGGHSEKFLALREGRYLTYRIIDETTQLPWMGDVILVPGPLPQIISVGDIVLVIGVFLLVMNGMAKDTENIRR